jgi:hypothetical protein
MPETIARDDPGERECLRCYILRMLRSGGCDNTRKWTIRWRDRRALGDEGLLARLEERGGICCDCEVLLNVWEDDDSADVRWPSCCSGADGADPLVLCAAWIGAYLRDAGDPYDYDDGWEEGFTFV